MRALAIVLLGAIVPMGSAFAQTSSYSPVEFNSLIRTTAYMTDVPSASCSTEALQVQTVYVGMRPLRGFVVLLHLKDPRTGEILSDPKGWNFPVQETVLPGQSLITTGDERTSTICRPPKSASINSQEITATVDVLLFSDGPIAGPIESRISSMLVGQFDGMDFLNGTSKIEKYVSPAAQSAAAKAQSPESETRGEPQAIGPLVLTPVIQHDEPGSDELVVEATNSSSQAIRGYVFKMSFFDANTGSFIRSVTTKEIETRGDPSKFLAPDGTWTSGPVKFSRSLDGSMASYKISLDLVVFANGALFGPRKSSESTEALGILRGIDLAKQLNPQSGQSSAGSSH
jgi:hypothetical protein